MDISPETIARALDGSSRERRRLAREVVGHIDRAVHYALRAGRHPTEQREDLVGDVLVYVFRNDAKVLRRWDPERAGLPGYLNMVTGRYVHRRRRGQPALEPSVDEESVLVTGAPLEDELVYRAALEELYDWVRTKSSEKDQARFARLLVQGHTPAEVAKEEGCSAEAIYSWISRFKRRIKETLPHVAELVAGHG